MSQQSHKNSPADSAPENLLSEEEKEKLLSYEIDPNLRPTSISELPANSFINIDATKRTPSLKISIRLVCAAVIIGVVAGLSIALLTYAIDFVTNIFNRTWWLPWAMPVAGFLTYGLYHLLKIPFSRSTSDVIDAARLSFPVHAVLAPAIFVGTCLTVLCGGSAGKEGAAMQLGGAISSRLGGLCGLHERRYQEVLLMCGIAAGLSAVLSAPITAFIFVFEVMHQLSKRLVRIIIPLISSFVSWGISRACGVQGLINPAFASINMGQISIAELLCIGIVCGICAWAFCKALRGMRFAISKLHAPLVALLVGGLIIGVLFCTNDVFRPFAGTGQDQMNEALAGVSMPAYGFAIKMLLTILTLSFGFKGGEVMPMLAIGACIGAALVYVLPSEQSVLVAFSMIAFFAGATNCPIASIFFGVWLFGPACIPAMILVCVLSYGVSISTSVYRSARVEYSSIGMIKELHALAKARRHAEK